MKTKHDLRDDMMKLECISKLSQQDKKELGKFIEQKVEEFRIAFGQYWSKVGDNVYIADPINNTRPIILSQEGVEVFIRNVLTQQREEIRKRIEEKKIVFDPNLMVGIFHDPSSVDGYNQALEDIITELNQQ